MPTPGSKLDFRKFALPPQGGQQNLTDRINGMADDTTKMYIATVQLQQVVHDLKSMVKAPECGGEACASLRAENARLLALLRAHPPPRPQMLPQRRLKLAARQAWLCALCRQLLNEAFHADHITPWCESFDDSDSNLNIICVPCHLAKTSEENSARNKRAAHH